MSDISSLVTGKNELPPIVDIGKFATLDYSKYPNIAEITKNSELSWVTEIPSVQDEKDFEHKLDVQYVRVLWKAIQKLPASERGPVEKFLGQSFLHKNIKFL